jgi:tRNA(Ile)-lysidine synthase
MVPSTADPAGPAGYPDPGRLLQRHSVLAEAPHLLVAFSGGMDSTVLLALLAELASSGRLSGELRALHVNHGLNPAASLWQEHCRNFCQSLGVAFQAVAVQVMPAPGESLEMAARTTRYRVFAEQLPPGGLLLQGHHQDDQAETFLYRLMRGNAPAGLGGIPVTRELGHGHLLRPLLDCPRAALEAWARARNLSWVEDPSNTDAVHDRNYLRSRVLPALQARWSHAGEAIARSAAYCRETAVLLDDLAQQDLAGAVVAPGNRLQVDILQSFSDARQRNALKYWLTHWSRHFGGATVTRHLLEQTVQDLIMASSAAGEAVVGWGTGPQTLQVRRYRNLLYVLPPLPASVDTQWQTGESLRLELPVGELSLEPTAGPGLPLARLGTLEVRFRAGGKTIKPPGRPSRTLKNLLQEHGVPPWLRTHVPLLYHAGELVAVGDLVVSADWWETGEGRNASLVWKRSDLDCGY